MKKKLPVIIKLYAIPVHFYGMITVKEEPIKLHTLQKIASEMTKQYDI